MITAMEDNQIVTELRQKISEVVRSLDRVSAWYRSPALALEELNTASVPLAEVRAMVEARYAQQYPDTPLLYEPGYPNAES